MNVTDYELMMLRRYQRNDIKMTEDLFRKIFALPPCDHATEKSNLYLPKIKKVIFNPPATIIFWQDDTKTVVKAVNESYDPEKGLAMAISKKAFGNNQSYYSIFEKNLKKF